MSAFRRRTSQGGWIRQYHERPAGGPTLVCFPHAGGSAAAYFQLSASLSSHVEVLIVQYPGRQDRMAEACIDDVRELAQRVTEALARRRSRPLTLFGHSMGSIVAYECALRLQEQMPGDRKAETSPLLGLIASGRAAPSVQWDRGVHRRDDAGIVAELTKLAGTDPALFADQDLLAHIIPPIRSDFKAAETYQCAPGTRLCCPISAYSGDSDPYVTSANLQQWAEHTISTFTTRIFPGDHFYLQSHNSEVAAAIFQDIAAFAPKTLRQGHGP